MDIGYVANSVDMLHPADRRRFGYFSRVESVSFEELNYCKEYEVVIVTIAANLSKILAYKARFPKAVMVFDYCDDLLSDTKVKQLIRPSYEFFKWKSFQNFRNYNTLVLEMLGTSEIIICGSTEQKEQLLQYNNTVSVIPDFVVNEAVFCKEIFELIDPPRVSVLWEGLSGNLTRIAADLFELLGSVKSEILLNVVTDPQLNIIGDRYIRIDTEKYLKKLAGKFGIKVRFWNWSKENLNRAAERSDLGIILIPKDNQTMQNKPENKLVLLSSFGLPVLVSSTPSYKRYLESAGGKELYSLSHLSSINLQKFCSQSDLRAFVGKRLRDYAFQEYGDEVILLKWKKLLQNFLL